MKKWLISMLVLSMLTFTVGSIAVSAEDLVESVEITPDSATIVRDSTVRLSAEVYPDYAEDQTIEWESSNTEIAIVNSLGVVKGLRKGTVTITATNPASFQSDSVTVTVTGKTYTDPSDVYDFATNAVAFLEAYNASGKLVSTASAFLISSDGRLVTNLHAVFSVDNPIAYVKAVFPNKSYNQISKLLGYDTTNDIAILQIENVSGLPYLDLAENTELKTGQKVVAIGSPERLENTFTQGSVSSKQRKLGDTIYIQTDVGISNGSSGGVLLNMKGEAVGITTSGFGAVGANLNFAIPIESLKVVSTNNPKQLTDLTDITISTVDGMQKFTAKINVKSLKLDKTTITLTPQKTSTVKATVAPANASNKKVTYTSSNTKIAKVDSNGKITALAVGTATITATTVDQSKTRTVTVNVITPITSLKLNKSSISLSVNQTSTLNATITPSNASNKKVTWSSSNTNVATVDINGKVKGIANGTATITATSADGAKTATCKVTVK